MKKRVYYISFSDPIQELIDRQLASVGFDFLFIYRKGYKDFAPQATSKKCSTNYMEDMFIEAIDRKYNTEGRREEIVYGMIVSGFTPEDISIILGISDKAVRKDIEAIKESIIDGENSD